MLHAGEWECRHQSRRNRIACWIQCDGQLKVSRYVDDEVQLDIWIDTGNIKSTGYGLYLSIDPTIFQPIFYREGNPFIPGPFLPPESNPLDNDTHKAIELLGSGLHG